MKKFAKIHVSLLLALILLLCSIPALASTAPLCEKLVVHFDLSQTENLETRTAIFAITDENGTDLGEATAQIEPGTTDFSLSFPVQPYAPGTNFKLILKEGISSYYYYDKEYFAGDAAELCTYAFQNEAGETVLGDTFHMTAVPYAAEPAYQAPMCQQLTVHLDFKATDDLLPKTVRFNIFNENDQFIYNSYADIQPDTQSVDIVFPIGPFEAGQSFKLKLTEGIKSFYYYDKEYFADEAVILDTYAYLTESGEVGLGDTFHMTAVPYTYGDEWAPTAEAFVAGISSKTDWLVWVSKKDFRTTAFKKVNDKWVYANSFKCTIGAPHTPTITGEFEYYMYQPKWYYQNYWCGPVMRFYNGYALHSTLIRYDGTYYDGRLGVKASLGCVRLHPDSIQWLVDTIPLHTKIYVTE